MELNIKNPIVFFDIESTGLNIVTDRIIEISIVKININNSKEVKTYRINPQIPISPEASSITGIKNEDVANCPVFKQVGKEIVKILEGCDIAGYNCLKFDIPILSEEFARNDIDFDFKKRKIIDVQNIFYKMEPRTLSAAYSFYCGKSLENAHSAEADTLATYEVLKAQLDMYKDIEIETKDAGKIVPIENNVEKLSAFSVGTRNYADFLGQLIYDKEGFEVFNFGKYKGQRVIDVFEKDLGYYGWILNSEFPEYTKKILTRIKVNAPKK